MLLQGCCLQHEVLLLGCVHLVQVLGCYALRSVDGVLDHLDCLSVWWDDAEGGRGRLGTGTDCCHGEDR